MVGLKMTGPRAEGWSREMF